MTGRGESPSRLPACVLKYVDGVVLPLGLRHRVCTEVRKELEDHFEDALCRVEGEDERERCAEKMVAEFGDGAVLALLIERGKRRCEKETAMNISGIVGLGILALVIGSALSAINPAFFVNVPWFGMCVGMTAALGMMSFGFHDVARAVRVLRVLLVRAAPETISSRQVSVLRGLIAPVYTTGVIGTLIGLTNALVSMDDRSILPTVVALLLVCLLYSVVLAECIIRPAVRLVEHGRRHVGDVLHASKEPKVKPEVEVA
jgi:type III secretory pathway component EscS